MTVRFDSIYNGDPVVLKYTKDSDRKQIELAYENADGFFPETLVYGSDGKSTLKQLITELLDELQIYFDDSETLDEATVEMYDDYRREVLFAFEDILFKAEQTLKGVV